MQPKQLLPPTDRDSLPSMQQEKARRSAQAARVAAMRERLWPTVRAESPAISISDPESAGQNSDMEPMAYTSLEYETLATLTRTSSIESMDVRPPSPDRSLPSPTQPLRLMTAEEVQERRTFLRQSKRPSLMRRCSSKVGKVVDGLKEWAATEDVPEAGPFGSHHADSVKPPPMPNTSAMRTLSGIPVISLAEAQAKVKANPLRHAF